MSHWTICYHGYVYSSRRMFAEIHDKYEEYELDFFSGLSDYTKKKKKHLERFFCKLKHCANFNLLCNRLKYVTVEKNGVHIREPFFTLNVKEVKSELLFLFSFNLKTNCIKHGGSSVMLRVSLSEDGRNLSTIRSAISDPMWTGYFKKNTHTKK